MNDLGAFSVVGVIPMATEKPCFCTPIFRDDDGALYAQSSSNGLTIEEFVDLGDFPSRSIVKLRSNRECRIGDELLSGFRSHTRQHLVDIRSDVYGLIVRDFHKYANDLEFVVFVLERVLADDRLFEVFSTADGTYLSNVLMNLVIPKAELKFVDDVKAIKMEYDSAIQFKVPVIDSAKWQRRLKRSERNSVGFKLYAAKDFAIDVTQIPSPSLRKWMVDALHAGDMSVSRAFIENILTVLRSAR